MTTNHEWLNLIEVSGPFLAAPVLREVLPQGLEALTSGRPQRLRSAYDEWRDAVDADDADLPAIHSAWIDEVLQSALEVDDQVLRRAAALPDRLKVSLPEHGVTIAPDLVIVNPTLGDAPLLLVQLYEPDTDLDATRNYDGLATTPGDRMVVLLRAVGCPVGLVTNGERWMLVHAPAGSVASFASWYARLWGQEPETLRAFVSLLGVRRFFGPEAERLPALFERSLKHQDDVTDALGEQVRRAVEVLVQSLDRADQDRNRDLLHDVDPKELYEAGLTVMMRLVFLLAAEERGLLLLGDPRYDAFYALSSLRMQLRADTEEILERRRSAWSRLLALFRGVYGGIDHPLLRLPAMGGSLFDPDRYPFLEGRKKGTNWRSDPAEPLPIDDRTVLLLLEAIQTFEGRTLSYRALDVEQIGHVYEGLLERTVQRVDDVTLELEGSAKAKNARVALGEIESARLDGGSRIVDLLKQRSERSEPAIRNAICREPDERVAARLLTVCRGDVALRDRILPYAELLRTDPWGYPLVHHAGAFVVVLGADRRESGTHYTPKSLTEKIVEETLTPIVYRGPAEGAAREDWKLKSAEELIDLKVCDPAMGSGAFLVQACRWLADRLVEAWYDLETSGGQIDDEGRIRAANDTAGFEPLSRDTEERAILARRLIAERCLYGVDKNPLAVELAKLSLWLTTLAKGRPFGFLDHNLRSGDSLLGIYDIRQLIELDLTPKGKGQLPLFGQSIRRAVDEAISLRTRLRSVTIRDIQDVETMVGLDQESRKKIEFPKSIADALVGIEISETKIGTISTRRKVLASAADKAASPGDGSWILLKKQSALDLAHETTSGFPRNPFHWPLEFPEVFFSERKGFDSLVANPPFVDSEAMTKYSPIDRDFLSKNYECTKGNWDLFVAFIERALALTNSLGSTSLLSPNKWLGAPYGSAIRERTGSSIAQILDFSRGRAFAGVGVAAVCSNFRVGIQGPVCILAYPKAHDQESVIVDRSRLVENDSWGFLLSSNIDILTEMSKGASRFGDYVNANDPFTVSEAYSLKPLIHSYSSNEKDYFRFVNTGTIDPFVTLWDQGEIRYLKSLYRMPIVRKDELKNSFPRRYHQACQPKLLLSGMRKFEAFLDHEGSYLAGKSSIIVISKNSEISLLALLGILNSKLMRFYVQESFGVLGVDGGISFSGKMIESLPLPKGFSASNEAIEAAVLTVLDHLEQEVAITDAIKALDDAVFSEYGIPVAFRERVAAAELRC